MNISRISNINKIYQLSGIKHSSKVSFGAVSIESDSFSLQTRNDLIISDGDKKITEDGILHNIEQAIPNISGEDLDKYSDEMDQLIKNEVYE